MTRQEITENLKKLWGLENDNQLGERLKRNRQAVYQWLRGARPTDINTEIMTQLLKEIEELNSKLKS